jgi:hypothetical protein
VAHLNSGTISGRDGSIVLNAGRLDLANTGQIDGNLNIIQPLEYSAVAQLTD